jgi:hypothetical protein
MDARHSATSMIARMKADGTQKVERMAGSAGADSIAESRRIRSLDAHLLVGPFLQLR